MPIRNRLLYLVITVLVLLLVAAGYYFVKSGRITNPIQTQANPFSSSNILLAASKGSDTNYDVYLVMADGSNKKLTSSDDADFKGGNNPTFSPDGKKIAYVGIATTGGSQIIEMNADGSGKTAISKMRGFKFMPSWSKDGKSILYVNQATADKSQAVQLDLAAGTEAVVTSAPNLSNVSWLPDGSGFTYLQSPDGKARHLMLHQNGKDTEIVVKNGNTQVTDFLTPAVSPGGKSVAFIRTSDNQAYTVSIDGKNVKLLSGAAHSVFGCSGWAGDGSYVVVSENDRTNGKAYVSKVSLSNQSVSRWVETGFTSIICPRVARY